MWWEALMIVFAFQMLFESPVIIEEEYEQLTVNYYMFGLTRCNNNDSNWTIHGLWPQHNATSWPEYCGDASSAFNRSALESILPELKRYWTACDDMRKDYEFWKHEWDKHGTCSLMGQEEYFKTALWFYYQYHDTYFRYFCENKHRECNVPMPDI